MLRRLIISRRFLQRHVFIPFGVHTLGGDLWIARFAVLPSPGLMLSQGHPLLAAGGWTVDGAFLSHFHKLICRKPQEGIRWCKGTEAWRAEGPGVHSPELPPCLPLAIRPQLNPLLSLDLGVLSIT